MAVDESRDQTGVYKSDLSSKLVQGIKCSKRSNFCRPGKKYVKSSNFFMVLIFFRFNKHAFMDKKKNMNFNSFDKFDL